MVVFHLHVCDGDAVLADAGWIDVASATTAIGAAMLIASDLKEDARFARARVVVKDARREILGSIPISDQPSSAAPHPAT